MNGKFLNLRNLFFAAETLLITLMVLFFVSPFSCRVTESGLKLISADYECPVLESYAMTDSFTMRMVFSKEVKLEELELSPSAGIQKVNYEYAESKDGLCFAEVRFTEALGCAEEFRLYGCAEDSMGNSLTFSLPFKGYNSNPAFIEMIEVHPKYQGETKGNGVFKNEYVLFKVVKGGNLSGLRFLSVNDGEEKSFTFPSVEVTTGELVNLHLRNKGSGCVNEFSSDLNLSTAYYSKDSVRDLWVENENACLGDDSDILIVFDSRNNILDAFLYVSSECFEWKKESFNEYALMAYESGKWEEGYNAESAFCSAGITASKSFVKNEKGKCREAWSIGIPSVK